jgi:hypothetical protein
VAEVGRYAISRYGTGYVTAATLRYTYKMRPTWIPEILYTQLYTCPSFHGGLLIPLWNLRASPNT